ncbi:hypothetical protein [uncultured Gelidibacter sp.]|uniref:hypothetical protein n=1 Tax=uncultured Gelidibacter sp. TaxID=259318 RepID=UPI0026052663|nr:hypothetical protein [uncultured Gelidibacter sp.]
MTNTQQEIIPSNLVPEVKRLQSRLNESGKNLERLTKNLEQHRDLIGETQKSVDDQWFSSSPSRNELWKLIKSDQESNSKTTKDIANLFKSVNQNTADLAQMVRGLAQLSCMTYEDLNKSFNEIKDNRKQTNVNGEILEKGQSQLNQLIKLHLDRAKNEREKEILFNQNMEKIDFALDVTNKSVNLKIEELNSAMEQIYFLKELNNKLVLESNRFDSVKKRLKLLTTLSVVAIMLSIASGIFIYIQLF